MLEIKEFVEQNKLSFLFSGDLSIARVAGLQQQLLKAPSKVLHADVKVADVENLDLSFLQLLLVWARSMKQSGKNLTFDFQLDPEFARIFDESGFRESISHL